MTRPLLPLLAVLLAAAAPVQAQDSTVVYVVRHAEKADASADPPLSAAGEARALALAERMAAARLDAVLVTQYVRTHATAAPTLAAARLAPWQLPTRGGELPHAEAVARAIRGELAGGTVLVVGHTSTVPAVVHALGGPELPELCETEYANLFVVVLRHGAAPGFERRTYGTPDPKGADVCDGT